MHDVLILFGTSLVTGLAGWFFGGRCAAKSSADRSEINNLKLITQEWREAAQIWKDVADEYQKRHLQHRRKFLEMDNKIKALARQIPIHEKN